MDNYQHNYAAGRPQMYEVKSRRSKAKRIVKLLENYYGIKKLKTLSLLDVGASTGIIDYELSKHFKEVVGVDIDKKAILFARKNFRRKNLKFKIDDAMKLSIKDSSFDIVICSQVYEHVPNDRKLMDEIYRVLKIGGVCYFAALNKFWPLEPHYNLLFLSWVPKKIGNIYLKIFNKGTKYHENLRSYTSLKKLTRKFTCVEYTSKILRNPIKFGYDHLTKFPINIFSIFVSPLGKYLSPTFFWLLIKK